MTALHFHPDAEHELREAAAWYEAERPGLGDRFVDDVDRHVARIAAVPQGGAIWRGGPARTWPLRGFPYIVAYLTDRDDALVVLAVAHTKRRPGYWMPRMVDEPR